MINLQRLELPMSRTYYNSKDARAIGVLTLIYIENRGMQECTLLREFTGKASKPLYVLKPVQFVCCFYHFALIKSVFIRFVTHFPVLYGKCTIS